MALLPYPDFFSEKPLWQKGNLVYGVDEVGRGAFAGPIVAAAVAFPPSFFDSPLANLVGSLGINDSKKLSPARRDFLAGKIMDLVLGWGIGQVSNRVIDRKGISWANEKAMRLAVLASRRQILFRKIQKSWAKEFLLTDAFTVSYLPRIGRRNQLAIIGGDGRSISVAAASIVAKVYRDRLMAGLAKKAKKWSVYGWNRNKGYGTLFHRQAIRQYGLCRWHRRSFARNRDIG